VSRSFGSEKCRFHYFDLQSLRYGETDSLVPEGTALSYITPASSNDRSSKVARLTAAARKTWTEARCVDHRLMEMRTNLSRHSG
jgi:hypothetical protein